MWGCAKMWAQKCEHVKSYIGLEKKLCPCTCKNVYFKSYLKAIAIRMICPPPSMMLPSTSNTWWLILSWLNHNKKLSSCSVHTNFSLKIEEKKEHGVLLVWVTTLVWGYVYYSFCISWYLVGCQGKSSFKGGGETRSKYMQS